MQPMREGYSEYWAPEVTVWDGKFYMYYGAGDGVDMHIRVATCDTPAGPFTDAGRRLTSETFAIDPHVFYDDDGRRWLFYATDFLEHTHIGTGTVRDLMQSPFSLEGRPSPVTRAMYDWQLFDPQRMEKGGVRWHTVEGPAVRKYKGIYYEMFSGGNWQNSSYGVGYAFTGQIANNEEWTQVCDGDKVLPLLRTIPDGRIGPGHNCIVRGPDNRQLYCVYHQWNEQRDSRLMGVSRLEFIGPELCVLTGDDLHEPLPVFPDSVDGGHAPFAMLTPVTGDWSVNNGSIQQSMHSGRATGIVDPDIASGVLAEVWIRATNPNGGGVFGLTLSDSESALLDVRLHARDGRLEVLNSVHRAPAIETSTGSCALNAYRHFQLTVSAKSVHIQIDEGPELHTLLRRPPSSIALMTDGTSADFAGLTLSRGWEDRFEESDVSVADLGWIGDESIWSIERNALHGTAEAVGALFKRVPDSGYEFVVNARVEGSSRTSRYGFYPAAAEASEGPLLEVRNIGGEWFLVLAVPGGEEHPITALGPFRPFEFEQFRFRIRDSRMTVARRGQTLLQMKLDSTSTRVGVRASGAVAFDMIRVSSISSGKDIPCGT